MTTNTKIYITAIDKTKKAFGSVSSGLGSIHKAASTTAKVFAGLTGLGSVSLGAIYTNASKAGDELAKTSDKLGIATEALASLQYAGELTGVSVNKMNMSLQRMTRRISEAAAGTGEAKAAIAELGLDASKLAQMSPDQAFNRIAEAMQGVGNQSDKVRLAMRFFDSEGVDLVNTLALGSDGLDQMRAEATKLGITLSRIDAAKMEAANDSIFKASRIGVAFGNQITTALAPIVNGLANEFLNVAKEAGGVGVVAGDVVNFGVKGVGIFADGVRGLQIAWKGVSLAIAGVSSYVTKYLGIAYNGVVEFLSLIPGVEVETSNFLANVSDSLGATYDSINKEVQDLLSEPLPSDSIEAWTKKVVSQSEEAAKKVAKNSMAAINSVGGGDSDTTAFDKNLQSKLDRLRESLLSEEQAEAESYMRRQQILNNAYSTKLINQERFEQLSSDLATKYLEKREELQQKETAAILENQRLALAGAAGMFGSLADVAKTFGKEQSKTYKALFAISKAFAIAESIVKIQQGIAGAAALPFPSNIPAMATVAAATANIVTTIKGTELEGMAHDGISSIPQDGTWLLKKGERVINDKQNDQIVRAVQNGTGGSDINITNVFQFPPGETTVKNEIKQLLPELEQLIQQTVIKGVRSGGSFARAVGAR